MPEQNGSESAARFERIERNLEQLAIRQDSFQASLDGFKEAVEQDHAYLDRELKNLLRSQILTQDQMDKDRAESQARGKELDARISALVSAIGALIAKRGPDEGVEKTENR